LLSCWLLELVCKLFTNPDALGWYTILLLVDYLVSTIFLIGTFWVFWFDVCENGIELTTITDEVGPLELTLFWVVWVEIIDPDEERVDETILEEGWLLMLILLGEILMLDIEEGLMIIFSFVLI